ncbi:hypothetical protein EV401DRAFT_105990 [Pisolithus croceorrhizus]|nr:hypothetical protein EV401DRAFT_105990 [Pisolithus croceorrhizus]
MSWQADAEVFLQKSVKVVRELDKTLFAGYVEPKSALVPSLLKEDILNPEMDRYATAQPTDRTAHVWGTNNSRWSVNVCQIAGFVQLWVVLRTRPCVHSSRRNGAEWVRYYVYVFV